MSRVCEITETTACHVQSAGGLHRSGVDCRSGRVCLRGRQRGDAQRAAVDIDASVGVDLQASDRCNRAVRPIRRIVV